MPFPGGRTAWQAVVTRGVSISNGPAGFPFSLHYAIPTIIYNKIVHESQYVFRTKSLPYLPLGM